jgi:hypothetical protein
MLTPDELAARRWRDAVLASKGEPDDITPAMRDLVDVTAAMRVVLANVTRAVSDLARRRPLVDRRRLRSFPVTDAWMGYADRYSKQLERVGLERRSTGPRPLHELVDAQQPPPSDEIEPEAQS